MKLKDVFDHIIVGTNLLVMVNLDVGTEESFKVEIMRGNRFGGWRKEYMDWLMALDLEVDHLSACTEDAYRNKDMLCITCKPIKVVTE